jgi:hypothetical protein
MRVKWTENVEQMSEIPKHMQNCSRRIWRQESPIWEIHCPIANQEIRSHYAEPKSSLTCYPKVGYRVWFLLRSGEVQGSSMFPETEFGLRFSWFLAATPSRSFDSTVVVQATVDFASFWIIDLCIGFEVRSRKPELTAVGIRCADHAAPSIR